MFSNAALHWMKRADVVIAGVYRSLKPDGRFVAECGGLGCVHKIRTALVQALDRRGLDGEARVPWYFPTPGDYATRLERAGFRVDSIALIPRPTPLPGDIFGFLETFALSFSQGFSDEARSEYLEEVRTVLEPQLRDANGPGWPTTYGCDSRQPNWRTRAKLRLNRPAVVRYLHSANSLVHDLCHNRRTSCDIRISVVGHFDRIRTCGQSRGFEYRFADTELSRP